MAERYPHRFEVVRKHKDRESQGTENVARYARAGLSVPLEPKDTLLCSITTVEIMWAHDMNDMLKAGIPLQEWVTSVMADYETIQTSKQLQASLPASEPAPAPVKATPILDCTITPIERGYTLTDHIARLKAQADEQEQTGPTDLEQAIMNKLQGYGLFIAKRCICGCRLKRHMAGGMYTVCARCEPGGLWSYQALEMLN